MLQTLIASGASARLQCQKKSATKEEAEHMERVLTYASARKRQAWLGICPSSSLLQAREGNSCS